MNSHQASPSSEFSPPSIGISRDAALYLAREASEDALLSGAEALRRAAFGRKVEMCAIINARSGNCGMDCGFCSQSKHNKTVITSFNMLGSEELRERLRQLADLPLRHVGIVTSGGALEAAEVEHLATVLESLPAANLDRWRDRVCGSLGRLPDQALMRLRKAGLIRFHHNLETAEDYYPHVCTTQSWKDRLSTVRRAMAKGLEVCSGGLFGLGESWEQRVDFALRLRSEGVEQVPVNFLHPHPGTRMAGREPLDAAEALRIVAVLRHILPNATLRICGGRPTVLGERQGDVFTAGANAIMTGDYLTTDGHGPEEDCALITAKGLEIAA